MAGQKDIAERLNYTIEQTTEGIAPSFSPEVLLGELGLAGDESDGQTLMERFAGTKRDITTFRALVRLVHNYEQLIRLTNRREANSAQESITYALGRVLTKQAIREGNICPIAQELIESSARDDLMPPRAHEAVQVAYDDGTGAQWETGERAVETAAMREQLDSFVEQYTGLPGGAFFPEP